MQRLFGHLLLLILTGLIPLARAVVGGAGIDPNTPDSPWAGVGAVLTGKGHYSGALIGPRQVLTAAHVVHGRPPAELGFRLNLAEHEAIVLPVAAVHVHPAFKGSRRGSDGFWRDDLAVLELARPAPPGVPVYPLFPHTRLLHAMIAFVGYGQGGDGERGAHLPGSPRVKRLGYNRIDALPPHAADDARPALFLFDFDGPDLSSNRLGAQAAHNGSLGAELEATFAGGDSGAPVFVFNQGAWRIAGIAAFVAGQDATPGRHGSLAGGTLVPAYLDWIRTVMQAGGKAAPTTERTP